MPKEPALRDTFARQLHLRRVPEVYVTNGNGQLNAFAASAYRVDFVVVHSELFANLYQQNRAGLAFRDLRNHASRATPYCVLSNV